MEPILSLRDASSSVPHLDHPALTELDRARNEGAVQEVQRRVKVGFPTLVRLAGAVAATG